MAEGFGTRLKRAFNAFSAKNQNGGSFDYGVSYSYRPDRWRLTRGNERTIVTAIYNRIALDAASISIRHVQLDDNGRYLQEQNTGLNNCLALSANIDQTGRAFIQDIVMSMFDEGCVAVVPIDTERDYVTGSISDIYSMRTGRIVAWYPRDIKVNVYNDRTGMREDLIVPKEKTAIIENPFYSVMNQPNSMVQRLIRKLTLLDAIDEQTGSGKLDLIIQLPYVVKSDLRKKQAEERRKAIEDQLAGSRYGVAYTDGTERITQLNRPIENNLLKQIEYLTNMVFGQMGMTQGIMDGTADEQTMLNYNNRIIEPIVSVISDSMKRSFLTPRAIKQGQSIVYFRDPFRLVPVSQVAEIADKFTRNEIMTSNEIRQIVGMKPSQDPKADELRNSNLNQSSDGVAQQTQNPNKEENDQNGNQNPKV